MKSIKAELDRRAVTIIVIAFADPVRLTDYQNDHQWPFVMLADPGRVAYRAFELPRLSLLNVFSFATLRLYCKLLREGKRIRNYGKDDFYQAGGDFLIDRDGNLLFAHRSRAPADRPTSVEILRASDRFTRHN